MHRSQHLNNQNKEHKFIRFIGIALYKTILFSIILNFNGYSNYFIKLTLKTLQSDINSREIPYHIKYFY